MANDTGADMDDYDVIVGEVPNDPNWEDYAFAADTDATSKIF